MAGSGNLSQIVKVGGSLFDLPDLGSRLARWLARESAASVVLIPGGGKTADVIRALDARHRLGEETAHWLALRALTVNAHFLASLIPSAQVGAGLEDCVRTLEHNGIPVLDPHAFAQWDEVNGRPNCLPHTWAVTSDALAARVAVVAEARSLVLLKSITIPKGLPWAEAGRRGFVDPLFALVVGQARDDLQVRAINFREVR
jgi:aspartokinase-like uncharacterized kinase